MSVRMNVSLTPELERFVQERVASGLYNNQSEVIREALRLLARDERQAEELAYLRRALAEGVAQADAGELRDGPSVIESIRKKHLGDACSEGG